jgi:hypothetical protein
LRKVFPMKRWCRKKGEFLCHPPSQSDLKRSSVLWFKIHANLLVRSKLHFWKGFFWNKFDDKRLKIPSFHFFALRLITYYLTRSMANAEFTNFKYDQKTSLFVKFQVSWFHVRLF